MIPYSSNVNQFYQPICLNHIDI